MNLKLIVAVDKNWGIGRNNELLVSIPEDMKFFRETTKNSTVIMGRKTLESFPNGNPLKNRENIVLTSGVIDKEGVVVFHSIEDVLEYVKDKDNCFVIGGASIYKQFLPYCNKAYVTKIGKAYDADTYFPNLDDVEGWEIKDMGEEKVWNDIPYSFITYEKY